MSVRQALRLIRACAHAGMTVRETLLVFRKVRGGEWEATTNREALAQAHYFRLLLGKRPRVSGLMTFVVACLALALALYVVAFTW